MSEPDSLRFTVQSGTPRARPCNVRGMIRPPSSRSPSTPRRRRLAWEVPGRRLVMRHTTRAFLVSGMLVRLADQAGGSTPSPASRRVSPVRPSLVSKSVSRTVSLTCALLILSVLLVGANPRSLVYLRYPRASRPGPRGAPTTEVAGQDARWPWRSSRTP